jgi:hypothetical protein
MSAGNSAADEPDEYADLPELAIICSIPSSRTEHGNDGAHDGQDHSNEVVFIDPFLMVGDSGSVIVDALQWLMTPNAVVPVPLPWGTHIHQLIWQSGVASAPIVHGYICIPLGMSCARRYSLPRGVLSEQSSHPCPDRREGMRAAPEHSSTNSDSAVQSPEDAFIAPIRRLRNRRMHRGL